MINIFKSKVNGIRFPADDENRIIEAIGYEDYSKIKDIVFTVYRITRIFPASEKYHYTEKGGLFTHSLDTAIHMHEEFKKYEREILITSERGVASMNDTAFLRKQYSLMAFLVGLLHDIGKVADYRVKVKNYAIQLNVVDLKDFLQKVDDIAAESVVVEKLPYRKDMIHAYLSAFLMHSVLESAAGNFDSEVLTKAVEAIALEHSPVADSVIDSNIIMKVLKGADSNSVQSYRSQMAEEKVSGYVAILKERIMKKKQQINTEHYFQTYIDKEKDYLVVNAMIAVNEMCSALKIEKEGMLGELNRTGIIAETDDGKEIMRIRMKKGTEIPVVVLRLSAFEFSDEFISSLSPCPYYELLKGGGDEKATKASKAFDKDRLNEKEEEVNAIEKQREEAVSKHTLSGYRYKDARDK